MQNNGYPNPNPAPNGYNPVPNGPAPSKGMAIASLVLGIISLVLAWFGYSAIVSIVLSIVGIILGVSARKKMPVGVPGRGMATGGLVCSIIALILSAIIFVACVICVGAAASAGLLS